MQPNVNPEIAQIRNRVSRLQQICNESVLDGILLATGVDTLYNIGGEQGVNFVLSKGSNRSALEPKLRDGLNETVIFIKKNCIDVYTPSPVLSSKISHLLTYNLNNSRFFHPTDEEVQAGDALDDHKLSCFVQMLQGCKNIGIALQMPTDDGKLRSIAAMELEKWPLLQAYGLDGVGRGGFFTMNFQVRDVSTALTAEFTRLDSCAIGNLLQRNVPVLMGHWEEVLVGLRRAVPTQRPTLTERRVAEPLVSFFAYGLLRLSPWVNKEVTLHPRIVFGCRTGDDTLSSDNITPLQAGSSPSAPTQGFPSLQMVVEGADPQSGLRLSRTYFLSEGTVAQKGYEMGSEGSAMASEAVGLMRLYMALVEAVHAGMEHYTCQSTSSPQSLREVMVAEMTRRSVQLGLDAGARGELRVALWGEDARGFVTPAPPRGTPLVKVLRASLSGLTVQSGPFKGQPLGGMVYGDSFIEVPGGSGYRVLNLTSAAPAIVAFSCYGEEALLMETRKKALLELGVEEAVGDKAAQRSEKVAAEVAAASADEARRRRDKARQGDGREKVEGEEGEDEPEASEEQAEAEESTDLGATDSNAAPGAGAQGNDDNSRGGLRQLGKLLTLGGDDDVILVTGCPILPAVCGSLLCFAHGFTFTCAHSGNVWVCAFADVLAGVSVTGLVPGPEDATTHKIGEVLLLRGNVPACGLPPATHLTINMHLAIAMSSFNQAARKHFASTVLPAWRQHCSETDVEWIKDPVTVNPFPSSVYAHAASAITNGWPERTDRRWHGLALDDEYVDSCLAECLEHETTSLVGPPHTGVEAVLTSAPNPSAVPLILIMGLPGSDQTTVAAGYQELLASGTGQRCIERAVVSSPFFGIQEMEQALAHTNSPTRPSYILLTTASFEDASTQLRALASTTCCTSGRVWCARVVCVVVADMAWEDPGRKTLLPGLLEQISPGLVDLVLLSGSTAAVSAVQSLISAHCPGVPIVRGGRRGVMAAREMLLPPVAEVLEARASAGACYARRWARPVPGRERLLSSGPLSAVEVKFAGALDIEALRRSLARYGLSDPGPNPASRPIPIRDLPPDAAPMVLLGLSGTSCSLSSAWTALRASISCALTVTESPSVSGAVNGSSGTSAQASWVSDGLLLFWGSALKVGELRALVEGCAYRPAQPAGPRTMLSKAERLEIQKQHQFDPLPDGVYFDSVYYVDGFGDRSLEHPELETFIQQHLQNLNLPTSPQVVESITSPLTIVHIKPC